MTTSSAHGSRTETQPRPEPRLPAPSRSRRRIAPGPDRSARRERVDAVAARVLGFGALLAALAFTVWGWLTMLL